MMEYLMFDVSYDSFFVYFNYDEFFSEGVKRGCGELRKGFFEKKGDGSVCVYGRRRGYYEIRLNLEKT
jgi:hypothetical protein